MSKAFRDIFKNLFARDDEWFSKSGHIDVILNIKNANQILFTEIILFPHDFSSYAAKG
jgi:hypothetical protein